MAVKRACLSALSLVLFLFFTVESFAQTQLSELYQPPRFTAMGGAGVAIADDEEAMFVNPAGLAGIKKFSVNLTTTNELSGDTVIPFLLGTSPLTSSSLGLSTINQLMGQDYYGRTQNVVEILMPHLGIAFLSDIQAGMNPKNEAWPQMTLAYQFTDGIQASYGTSLLKGYKNQSDLRIGFGVKFMWRRGGYYLIPTTDLLNLSTDTLAGLVGNYGLGIGEDAGIQYIRNIGRKITLSAGLSYIDVGNLTFTNGGQTQLGNLTVGVAAAYKLPAAKITLAYDYDHLTDAIAWQQKSHLGLEIALPVLSFQGGIYQTQFTYGFALDFGLIKINALSYANEESADPGTDSERRYDLSVNVKFGL